MKNKIENTELNQFLANWKSKMTTEVKMKAQHYTSKGLPKAISDNINHYIGFIKEKCKTCLNDIDKIMKLNESVFNVKQLRDKRDGKVFNLNLTKDKLQDQLNNIPESDRSEGRFIRIQSIVALTVLLLLASAEAILCYRPFMYITGSQIASISISIVFGIIWAFGADKFLYYWHLGKGVIRFLRRTALVIGCTLVFYIIAHLRVLEKASRRAMYNDEPLPNFFDVNYQEVLIFTLVGWLFFLGGVWVSAYTPTWSEFKNAIIEKWNRIRVKKLEGQIQKVQNQIDDENNNVTSNENAAFSLINTRRLAVDDVENYYFYLVELFKEVNYMTRTDGVYPDCFDDSIIFDVDTSVPDLHSEMQSAHNLNSEKFLNQSNPTL